jgi:hypothetical protein
MSYKSRLPNQFPRSANLSHDALATLDSMLVQVNTLLGQGSVPPGTGVPAFGSAIIDPTGAQVITGGQRTGSVTTTISYTSTTTSITFYWDGTNGSQKMVIARDDGTTTGPLITGSPQTVTGLTANTQYFFYMYWDETLNQVKFATVAGTAVGSPAYAFTSSNTTAAQQQILKNRILLSPNFSSQGIKTPSAGTGSGAGGTGGGSGGAQQTFSTTGSLTVVGGGFTKIQAGTTTSTGTGGSGGSVTFPVPFTTVVAVALGNYSGSCDITTGSLTTSGFSLDTSSTGQRIDWIAVGT